MSGGNNTEVHSLVGNGGSQSPSGARNNDSLLSRLNLFNWGRSSTSEEEVPLVAEKQFTYSDITFYTKDGLLVEFAYESNKQRPTPIAYIVISIPDQSHENDSLKKQYDHVCRKLIGEYRDGKFFTYPNTAHKRLDFLRGNSFKRTPDDTESHEIKYVPGAGFEVRQEGAADQWEKFYPYPSTYSSSTSTFSSTHAQDDYDDSRHNKNPFKIKSFEQITTEQSGSPSPSDEDDFGMINALLGDDKIQGLTTSDCEVGTQDRFDVESSAELVSKSVYSDSRPRAVISQSAPAQDYASPNPYTSFSREVPEALDLPLAFDDRAPRALSSGLSSVDAITSALAQPIRAHSSTSEQELDELLASTNTQTQQDTYHTGQITDTDEVMRKTSNNTITQIERLINNLDAAAEVFSQLDTNSIIDKMEHNTWLRSLIGDTDAATPTSYGDMRTAQAVKFNMEQNIADINNEIDIIKRKIQQILAIDEQIQILILILIHSDGDAERIQKILQKNMKLYQTLLGYKDKLNTLQLRLQSILTSLATLQKPQAGFVVKHEIHGIKGFAPDESVNHPEQPVPEAEDESDIESSHHNQASSHTQISSDRQVILTLESTEDAEQYGSDIGSPPEDTHLTNEQFSSHTYMSSDEQSLAEPQPIVYEEPNVVVSRDNNAYVCEIFSDQEDDAETYEKYSDQEDDAEAYETSSDQEDDAETDDNKDLQSIFRALDLMADNTNYDDPETGAILIESSLDYLYEVALYAKAIGIPAANLQLQLDADGIEQLFEFREKQDDGKVDITITYKKILKLLGFPDIDLDSDIGKQLNNAVASPVLLYGITANAKHLIQQREYSDSIRGSSTDKQHAALQARQLLQSKALPFVSVDKLHSSIRSEISEDTGSETSDTDLDVDMETQAEAASEQSEETGLRDRDYYLEQKHQVLSSTSNPIHSAQQYRKMTRPKEFNQQVNFGLLQAASHAIDDAYESNDPTAEHTGLSA